MDLYLINFFDLKPKALHNATVRVLLEKCRKATEHDVSASLLNVFFYLLKISKISCYETAKTFP